MKEGSPAVGRGGGVALLDRLPLFLALQAALLFYDLDLLPIWGDEYFTLDRAVSPARLPQALAGDVHPPLYYLLVHYWMRLPHWGGEIAHARALSALVVLVALVAVDRLWLREVDVRTRRWFLVLWALSPFLLLYGRMARNYSLQLLLGVMALRAGWALARHPRSPKNLLAYTAAATLLAYTHYLPALAIILAVGLELMLRALRDRDRAPAIACLTSGALVTVLYAPWMLRFGATMRMVIEGGPVRLGGSALLDAVLGLAHAFVSFSFGESLPERVMAAAAVVSPGLLLLLWRGGTRRPEWARLVGAAAAVTFAGATHWVAAAFVGARMVLLFPFYLLWLLAGRDRSPALGNLVCAGLVCVSLGSIHAYFTRDGFLNEAYVLPVGEIAAQIRMASEAGPTLVLADHERTNVSALRYFLPAEVEIVPLMGETPTEAIRRLVSDRFAVVWVVASTRNPHAEEWLDAARSAVAARPRRLLFLPHSRWHRLVLGWLGDGDPPTHAIVAWEIGR